VTKATHNKIAGATATPAGAGASTNEKIKLVNRGIVCACMFAAVGMTARAQFKEVAPAPYTPVVARQKIRSLIGNAAPQTAEALSKLLVWYRDIVDDELIAAWKGDNRANLPVLITPLADSRLASAIVEFSWRQQPAATFNLTYAPMLGDLMARYQSSAEPFLRDLLGPAVPDLPQPVADAVCRILLDMPDTGNWNKTALQILPKYRLTAQALLMQDLRGSNQEKIYRAQFWMADLKLNVPGVTSDQQKPRSKPTLLPAPVTGLAAVGNQSTGIQGTGNPPSFSQRPHIVEQPAPQPSASQRSGDSGPSALAYSGPRSGTLKCSGAPVQPNAEYVFPGMPMGNLQIDVDGKPWEARLALGTGQTQDLILTNKGSRPQKGCTIRWSLIP
jgi:hypothetical protein